MNFYDEQIAAWLHGHLDSDEAARVAAQVAGDPELTPRADRLRRLDELFRQAVPLDEALPDALIARLGLTAPSEAAMSSISPPSAAPAPKFRPFGQSRFARLVLAAGGLPRRC